MEIGTKNDTEKNKLLLEKEKERQELEHVIDVLKDRAIDREDKNKQLDESNEKKDIKIEQLREKLENMLILKEEFLIKISVLEEQNSSSSETNEKQQNEIKYLEGELARLENELQIIKYKYELQNKAIYGLTTEIKQQKVEMNAHFNNLNKKLEMQSEESAKVITMLENFSGAKDDGRNVNIQTEQHVTFSLNQKGGHTGVSAERKVVPVRIFNPQIRSNGKFSISLSKRTAVNRKDQQKAE
ncbi:Hypothetical predicted protein [Mytilus galloprovincialis]|uniref:Uncharacterized protein n=1 Tax=Mytilus galloprovincialis TaxID=29158 RepID=A0A8B6D1U3_MYTGA|nr:Hypothetical predicted protein [Mytilus galloprovincialis]